MIVNPDDSYLVPAFVVNAVDATAAGDAFTGGFAYAIANGNDIKAQRGLVTQSQDSL